MEWLLCRRCVRFTTLASNVDVYEDAVVHEDKVESYDASEVVYEDVRKDEDDSDGDHADSGSQPR